MKIRSNFLKAIFHYRFDPPMPIDIVAPLPDDIIIEILSRLPAEDVLRCRKVSKQWRDLTSTQTFIDLHREHAIPNVIVGQFKDMELLDLKNWKIGKMGVSEIRLCGKSLNKLYHPTISHSCDGLLLLYQSIRLPHSSSRELLVCLWNPVTQDSIMRLIPEGEIFGVFRHPVSNNYCIVWRKYARYRYRILDVEEGKWMGKAFSSKCFLASRRSPIVCNDSLHWLVYETRNDQNGWGLTPCVASIVVLDTKNITNTKEFSAIPHPEFDCDGIHCKGQHIFKMDGRLSFCRVSEEFQSLLVDVEIWVLAEDVTNEGSSWIKRHAFTFNDSIWVDIPLIRVVGVVNGEFVMGLEYGKEFVAFNLKTGSMAIRLQRADRPASSHVHVPSLVTLKRCKASNLRILMGLYIFRKYNSLSRRFRRF